MKKLREWIDTFERLERACVAGIDEEFRDDVLLLLNVADTIREAIDAAIDAAADVEKGRVR
ncbi:hypothetical protein [Xanthomonas albilineans]|uniref:hypothetical protein n=1 Tax=Xanthomonas albilineans TaxID=29447 RepID=UPI000AC62EC4|nr:hypothetical protein [Xanthomonas albilineans]